MRLVLALSILLLATAHCAVAQEMSRETLGQLKQGTVFIRVEDAGREGTGSGFLLGRLETTGYVVTNSHVVTGPRGPAKDVNVVFHSGTRSEKSVKATIVGNDPARDLAVLKVTMASFPEMIRSDKSVELYETLSVYILGFPFGEALAGGRGNPAITVSNGTVSSIRKDEYDRVAAIQIDGSINPGNSGGPIVTKSGDLLGIAVATIEGTQIGLAIPASDLREMLLGTVGPIAFQETSNDKGKASFQARGLLIDPMRRIGRVAIMLVRLDQLESKPKPDEHGKWGPAAPDAQVVHLEIDDDKLSGKVTLVSDPKKEIEYLVQPVCQRGDGEVVYCTPGKLLVLPPTAVARLPNRPRPGSGDWLGKVAPGKPDGVAPITPKPPADRPAGSLAGEPRMVGDVRVTAIEVEAETLVSHLAWSSDALHLFTLSKNGLLRKISLPDMVEVQRLDLASSCSFLGRSKEGLVVVLDALQQVSSIDEQLMTVKKQVRVAGAGRAACAPATSIAFIPSGSSLVLVDLRAGRAKKQFSVKELQSRMRLVPRSTKSLSIDFDHLTLTPDGKYLFAEGGIEALQRMQVRGESVIVEEFSPRIGQNSQEIIVSDDASYVAMPSGGGNYPAEGHPRVGYGTYIYSVTDLQSPQLGISTGAYPRMLGFDSVARKIYAQNYEQQLIVVNSGGMKEGEYSLSGRRTDVRRFLVHPFGYRLCVLTSNELFWVELVKYMEPHANE